jgi:hypothetical protein
MALCLLIIIISAKNGSQLWANQAKPTFNISDFCVRMLYVFDTKELCFIGSSSNNQTEMTF